MRAFVFEFWIVTFIKKLFDKEVIVEIDGTFAKLNVTLAHPEVFPQSG